MIPFALRQSLRLSDKEPGRNPDAVITRGKAESWELGFTKDKVSTR